MPRKKLIRHFEPRYGVSQQMVDHEAIYVAREHQDYMLLASNDLKEKLRVLHGKWHEADATVEMLVRSLPERDALAFQCLLVRDTYLILELYASCLKTARRGDAAPLIPAPVPPAEKMLPFSEWLFEPRH